MDKALAANDNEKQKDAERKRIAELTVVRPSEDTTERYDWQVNVCDQPQCA